MLFLRLTNNPAILSGFAGEWQTIKPMNNMQEFQIEVYNAYGQQQEIRFSENTPDLSELPNGNYTIRFRQGNDTYTEDFIKK